jgi:MFS family permease
MQFPEFRSVFPALVSLDINVEIVVALLLLGAVLGAAGGGPVRNCLVAVSLGGVLLGSPQRQLMRRFGRRRAIQTASLAFVTGSVLMCSAFSWPQLAIGRFFAGVGVGIEVWLCS